MRIHPFLIALFLIFSISHVAEAQDSKEVFTIYLVRHAEKVTTDKNTKDPSLTPCGMQRAESLAGFFEQIDLQKIYSTDYTRTKNTANPVAKSKEKELEFYDPRSLEDFAKIIRSKKENALIVGHSNTTGVLAGLLSEQEIGSFDESIYNRIYQVVFFKQEGNLQILTSSFVCDE